MLWGKNFFKSKGKSFCLFIITFFFYRLIYLPNKHLLQSVCNSAMPRSVCQPFQTPRIGCSWVIYTAEQCPGEVRNELSRTLQTVFSSDSFIISSGLFPFSSVHGKPRPERADRLAKMNRKHFDSCPVSTSLSLSLCLSLNHQ